MKRGELRWGTPPASHGPKKKRPFLVVSEDAFNENDRYRKVLVVHLTSVRHPGGPYAWEVEVQRGVAGLRRTSIVKCQEIYTVLKVHLGELIGTLPRDHLERVDRALALSLGLPVRDGS
jgi:mRNA-degrading endonuclease toxin of MazEF toxin-antitoxin module